MKMNALCYMIKYLPGLLVNFQAAIFKNLLLTKCRAFSACRAHHHSHNEKISFALQRACSSAENPFNRNNCPVVKSFRRIMNFYTYQVNQRLLTNTLNR